MRKQLLSIFALLLGIFQIYTAINPFNTLAQRSLHVGGSIIICILIYALSIKKIKSNILTIVDSVLIIIALIGTMYVNLHFERIIYDLGYARPTNLDIVIGLLMIFVLIEVCRRAIGLTFSVLTMVFIFYAMFGNYFPGLLKHNPIPLSEIGALSYLNPLGIYGSVTGASAGVIAIFIMFGSFLLYTGGGETFLKVSKIVAGNTVGGAAKIAVVASSLFGMINGSTSANVATTGSVTIPMMKRNNYPAHLAAAVEATASCGGQILPPIMGAGAFIMAELLEIPYLSIIKAAAIPGLLYFVALFINIHLLAKKLGLKPEQDEKTERFWEIRNEIVTLIIPIAVLLIFVLLMYSPTLAAFYSIMTVVLLHLLKGLYNKNIKSSLYDIYKSIVDGGKTVATIGVLIACAQIIIAIVGVTGLGLKFSNIIAIVSQTSVILSLIVTMLICMILGMGLPTVPAYVISIAVAGSALRSMGLMDLQAHLFVFYFSVLSAITPPVAGAVYVASMIAEANWWSTAKSAIMLGFGGFIIPYMFVLNPALLGVGSYYEIGMSLLIAIYILIIFNVSLVGHFDNRVSFPKRVVLFVGALFLLSQNIIYVGMFSLAVLAMYLLPKIRKFQHSAR
ncbi:MAG: TRAP transporter permease DctM/Q [Ignavibacteriae bacterium HGW-Ignavibacteriae-4]|jgi:TRAP transporter 4TM/12TM fusion protein|nr:MAG: TRAP transporter permease DctM/Q [Ignavibacteriae bacterium HGW-Ignavibacteriae-4]